MGGHPDRTGIRARGETRCEGAGAVSWEGGKAGLSEGKGLETWVEREDGSRLQKPLKAREAMERQWEGMFWEDDWVTCAGWEKWEGRAICDPGDKPTLEMMWP